MAGEPARWKRTLGIAGGVVLGAVLLVAAWTKILDPLSFAEFIRGEGLDFLLPASAVAFATVAIEVALGVALVSGVRRRWVLGPAALLVVFFLVLNARSWWLDAQGLRAEAVGCGCFGNLLDRTPAEAFWQDLLLLLPPLALAFVGRPRGGREFPPRRSWLIGLATAAAVGLTWVSPALPLDDLATRLRPGVEVDRLCAGDGEGRICLDTLVPELGAGRHLVVLADLGDREFGEAVAGLNAYVLADSGPRLWAVAAAEPDAQSAFFWTWGPAFEVREAPPALLAPLYRRLPRSFLVENGTVRRTFPGLPPVDELAG